jgi:hypothetical protein
MSKQKADENIIGCWRKTADENDERAQRLEELAYEMFNLALAPCQASADSTARVCATRSQ